MRLLLLLIIKFYKKTVSPILVKLLGEGCRFTPTCSDYSIRAIKKFGVIKGTILSFKRLLKCHPLGEYGYDPI